MDAHVRSTIDVPQGSIAFGSMMDGFRYGQSSKRSDQQERSMPHLDGRLDSSNPKKRSASVAIKEEEDDLPPVTTFDTPSTLPEQLVEDEFTKERAVKSELAAESGEVFTIVESKSMLPVNASPRAKRTKRSSRYAPPSTYAHLPKLPDKLAPNLICVFIGLNAGLTTAAQGHSYAHPGNLFWKLLHSSGCTPVRCRPEEDVTLPKRFLLGNTNLVDRPTRNQAELKPAELVQSVPVLEEKIAQCQPTAVCIVGKGIWEAIYKKRHGKALKKADFEYGWQDGEPMGKTDNWAGARVFVSTSTSGLAASTLPHEKERIWAILGGWIREQRLERLGQTS